MPWLITTTGWPTLALHLATTTAHVTSRPAAAVVGGAGAAMAGVACASTVVWRTRARRRAAGPTT